MPGPMMQEMQVMPKKGSSDEATGSISWSAPWTTSWNTSCTFLMSLVSAAMLLIMAGCAEENWNLVNPPPGGDSILVRFV
ncbi:MAG: hypothetical protein ACKOBV_01615, partial [Candidatus Kapaibacterium sp.]